MRHSFGNRILVVATSVAGAMAAASVSAQSLTPAPPPAASRPTASNWRISTGYDWIAVRDIARTGQPVDASPISWRGDGMSVDAQYSRTHGSRLHRYEVTAAFAGDFTYRSPLGSVGRPSGDGYRAISGSYEYRRYPFTNVGVRGLDAGIGVQAIGSIATFTQHVPVNLTATHTMVGSGTAIVAAARLHRWSRVSGEVAWTNGGEFLRFRDRDGEAFARVPPHWGGGWISSLAVSVDVRLSRRASLVARYVKASDGWLSDHQSLAASHGVFVAGVSYAK